MFTYFSKYIEIVKLMQKRHSIIIVTLKRKGKGACDLTFLISSTLKDLRILFEIPSTQHEIQPMMEIKSKHKQLKEIKLATAFCCYCIDIKQYLKRPQAFIPFIDKAM